MTAPDVDREAIRARLAAIPDEPIDPSWPIDRDGICDGCAEDKHLVLAISMTSPDGEPWLCQECAALATFAAHAPEDIAALLAALDECEAAFKGQESRTLDWMNRYNQSMEWYREESVKVRWLTEQRDAALARHRPRRTLVGTITHGGANEYRDVCDLCGGVFYPCATARALGVDS